MCRCRGPATGISPPSFVWATISPASCSGQTVCHNTAAGTDGHILLAVFTEEGERRCGAIGFESGGPELLACLRFKGVECFVLSGANEEHPASGRNGTTRVLGSGLRNSLGGERFDLAKGLTPGDFSRCRVDGEKLPPWRLRTGITVLIDKRNFGFGQRLERV